MSLTKRMSPALIAGLIVVLAATALDAALADSDEPGESTETLNLQPGDNLVGWVAEPIAVADFFEQIPEAVLIYRWDADMRRWQYAINAGDRPLGNLETLDPGMAAQIRIGGDRSVKWERPLTPAKGMVTLYSGENWVAWSGRDEWPLDQVARGIGTSLLSIEVRGQVYQPNSDVSEVVGPLTGEATIRRGDALRVTVNRDLRWLQPTGMMPKIAWAGDPPQSLRDKILVDIQRVVDFFAEEFAIESDFSDTTIVLFDRVADAVAHEESGREPRFGTPPGWVADNLPHLGALAFSWGTFVPICAWQPPCTEPPRDSSFEKGIQLLAHEMFHILQYHLSQSERLVATLDWMDEGAAMWAEWRVPAEFYTPGRVRDGVRLQRLIDGAARTSVRLQDIEEHNHNWAYRLGQLGARQLAELSGADSVLEFYRLSHPQIIGVERRWVERPQWRAAFEIAFGITPAEFYDRFAVWRATLPVPAERYDYARGDVTLADTLHYSDGEPAAGFRLNASSPPGEPRSGIERQTTVNEEGTFSIDLPPNSKQRISFTRGGCRAKLIEDGLTTAQGVALQRRDLDTRNLPFLKLTLPEGACTNELRANVVRLRGDQRHVSVYLRDAGSGEQVQAHSAEIADVLYRYAPEPGTYRVRVRIGGCELSFAGSGFIPSWQDGDVIALGEEPVSIELRVPTDLCVYRISGRILHEDGTALGGVWLHMGNGPVYTTDLVPEDGEFSMAVPESGDYFLSFRTDVPGCRIYYSPTGAVASGRLATRITVSDEDVTGIEFVVPTDPSSLCR